MSSAVENFSKCLEPAVFPEIVENFSKCLEPAMFLDSRQSNHGSDAQLPTG